MCEIIYLNISICCNGFNGFKIGFIWKKYWFFLKLWNINNILWIVGIGGLWFIGIGIMEILLI